MLRDRIRNLFGQEEEIPEAMWDSVYRIEYFHKTQKLKIFFEDVEGKQIEELDNIVAVYFKKCCPDILTLRTDASSVEPEKGFYFSVDERKRTVHVWPEGH